MWISSHVYVWTCTHVDMNTYRHEYIYMCAKEDFSGTHNFAATYAEHLKNAKKYTDALNNRGIK